MDHEANLRALKLEMEEIAGEWDGDKDGYAQERAQQAAAIMTACDDLIELLDELHDL